MIRESWGRHMDAARIVAVVLFSVASGCAVMALAVTPGFVVSGDDGAGGFAKLAPAAGAAVGMAVRGYAFHRKPGTRDGLRWAVTQGGLMALTVLGMFLLAALVNPIVTRNPALGGDAWLGLLAISLVAGASSGVMWERHRRRRRIAAVLLLAVCGIVVGLVGLRVGGSWIVPSALVVVAGFVVLALAALESWSELMRAVADSAA